MVSGRPRFSLHPAARRLIVRLVAGDVGRKSDDGDHRELVLTLEYCLFFNRGSPGNTKRMVRTWLNTQSPSVDLDFA